ncbi:MAG TPA: Gar1/Naf1 family protein [Candidatus Bathyarchaeia archaeon]|nr:Gar1/Naf1 family protein [Candidatus Bathyarchaeia archaeon]
MKKLGKVFVVTKKGELLVKATDSYRFNTKVVNQQIQMIGKIVDIIGPVATPYVVINTRNSEAQAKKGDQLYLMEGKPSPKKPTPYKKDYSKKRNYRPSNK